MADDRPLLAILNDGEAYTTDGKKLNQAYELAGRAVVENPNCWKMHRALGHVFLAQHRPQFAGPHFAKAAHLFRRMGKQPEFIRVLLTEQGRAALQEGNLGLAKSLFERALSYEPIYLPAKVGLEETLSRETATGERGFNGHKLLDEGHELERAGRYAEAWDCYTRAKAELQARGYRYDRAGTIARFNAYRSGCTAANSRRLDEIARRSWNEFPLGRTFSPIFILGYPRSGTTLLEQILGCSHEVTPAGETPYIVELVNASRRMIASDRPYPFCLDELAVADTEIAIQAMRYHYIARVAEKAPGQIGIHFFTDKMPLNECYLPFLHLLFPYAPKILIKRDRRDVIVSNFSLFLTHGSHQADSPINCADHIGLVDGLVSHYRQKMAWCRLELLNVNYENLVRSPERVIREICDFAKVEFSPLMLHPEKVTRYAHTASYAQVREPINDKGVGRWLHFAQQLEEVGIR